MSKQRTMEFAVGVFMLLGMSALLFLALSVSNFSSLSDSDSYQVEVRFENIGGLKNKAAVTMAGVEVGRVDGIIFDPVDFRAVVTMNIQSRFNQIPADTSARILTAGLLGEQYIGLSPGGSEKNLADGDEIILTQSALVLEDLIGQLVFSKAQESGF